jgi:xylan 1,4-beta-xylosidase
LVFFLKYLTPLLFNPLKFSDFMKLLYPLLLVTLLIITWFAKAENSVYTDQGNGNPLLPGYFADPTIKKIGDTYYLYATTDGIKLASGEPQVWISKDFVNWYNFEMNIPLPSGLTNCWAPDVVEGQDGKYYYFQGNCQAGCNIYGYVANTPMGPWTRLKNGKAIIPVGTGKEGLPALDAQFFIDDDGALYSFFGTWCTSFGGIGWAKLDSGNMTTILDQGLIPLDQVPNAFEAPYLFKKNGKYILMYSSGDCQLSSYAVNYSYSDNVTGPYTYGANNKILSTNSDNTVDSPGHHSVLKQGEDYYIIYHRHDNPHSTGGEFRQVCADKLIFENDSTIRKVEPTHIGVGYLAENQIPFENLALNAVASATSYYHMNVPATKYSVSNINYEYLPQYAVDDNNGTMWKAGDNKMPHSLVVDLGNPENVKRVMIQFEYPTFYYQYKIEHSSDNLNWELYADKTGNRRSGSPMIDDNDVTARYLKITVTGTEKAGMFAAIWNVKVYDNLFEIPSYQNSEIAEGPGVISTQSLLMDLNIDTLNYGEVVNNLPNKGSLGGEFLKYLTPTVTWYDSVKAVKFDGKSFLKLSEIAPSLDWNSSYTASVWVNNPKIGTGECLMAWCSRSNMLMASYTAMMYGTGTFGAVAHGDGHADIKFLGAPKKDEWHHLVLTFDGMLERVYEDGALNTQLPISLFVESSTIKLGNSGEGTENFTGYIANAQLYDKAFTEEEILQLMEKTRPEMVAAPVTDGILNLKNSDNYLIGYNSGDNTITVTTKNGTPEINSLKLIALDGKIISVKQYQGAAQAKLNVGRKGVYILRVQNIEGGNSTEKIVAY